MKSGTQLSMTPLGVIPRGSASALLEDEDQDPIGGARREQVQQDRLDRDDDRVEGHEHQQEREPEHEQEDRRDPVGIDLGDVDRERGVAGHVSPNVGESTEDQIGSVE